MENIPIEISDIARKKLSEIFMHSDIPEDMCCKIVAEANGCSDVDYQLAFDYPTDMDGIYEVDDLTIAIPNHQLIHFFGVKLDFKHEGETTGFMFFK